jgi:class 3 adenylate cyclase/tetratricopeptide (TPR) repeat protein
VDVAAWLKNLGLGQYEAAFRDNAIDGDLLPSLTAEDLKDLGVTIVGHRRKLLDAIAVLGAASTSSPPPAAAGQPAILPAPAVSPRPQPRSGAEAERRPITVMFCDLVGSTSLASKLDPEDWRNLVNGYLDQASAAVTGLGGHVLKKLGDGLMALFGYPQAQENDAERAVRAALAIQRALGELNARNAARGAPELSARIGIETGPVVVDATGEVFGEAPNVAARVQAAAEPGSILVTGSVQRQVAGLFVVEEKGAHELKGLAQPLSLYRVVRASGGGRRGGARTLTPFVGREEELGVLARRWERTRAGEGQLVLIVGEPGLGKSRLIDEFHTRLAETPHTWVEWSASQLLQNTPLHPIVEWGRHRFGLDAPAEQRLADLKDTLRLIGLDPAEHAPLLAPLVDIPLPPERAASFPPEELRRRQLAAMTALVLAGARSQPVVLAFEDLHWADPTSLDLLRALSDRGAQAPLLLLATTRPEFRPPWSLRSHHSLISLSPLDRAGVARMIGEISASHALSKEVIEGVSARTGGVPLFVEEVTRLLLERGEQGGVQAIPPTLQQSLAARLDRLGPAREVVQIGAVLGRDFAYALLRDVAEIDEPALQASLDRLADADLLFVEGAPPEASYRFKHALIQDAAYDSLLKSRRQALHRRAAEVPVEAKSQFEAIAHHFTQAGLDDLAIEWWGKAGDQALRRSAFQEAIAHLGKAIEMADKGAGVTGRRAAGDPVAPTQHLTQLHVAYGNALIAARGYSAPETAEAFARARESGSSDKDAPARLAADYGLWAGSFVRGDLPLMRAQAAAFLADVEATPESAEAGVAYRAAGMTCWFVGQYREARDHFEKALALFQPGRDDDLAFRFGHDEGVAAMIDLAFVSWLLGEVDRALTLIDRAEERIADLTHIGTHAYGKFNVGIFRLMRGDRGRAAENAFEVARLAREYDLNLWRALGEFFEGWARGWSGAPGGWLEDMRRGAELLREQNISYFDGLLKIALAEAEAGVGDPDRAVDILDEALAICDRTGYRAFEAELNRVRGEILLKRDPANPTPAEQALQTAIAVAKQQATRSFELRAALSLAKLYQSTSRPVDALAVLAPALEGFAPTPEMPEIAEALSLLAALAESEEVKAAEAQRQRRLHLQTAYGQAVMWSKGFAAEETKAAFTRATDLAVNAGDFAQRFAAAHGQWTLALLRGELRSAIGLASACLREAENAGCVVEVGVAHRGLGLISYYCGDFAGARSHCERAIDSCGSVRDQETRERYSNDTGCLAMGCLAVASWQLGNVERARALIDAASRRASELSHVPSMAHPLHWRTQLELLRGDAAAALSSAETLEALSREHGMTFWSITGELHSSWARGRLCDPVASVGELRRALKAFADQGAKLQSEFFEALLAQLEAEALGANSGLARIDEALLLAHQSESRCDLAFLHRVRGDILLRRDSTETTLAEGAYRTAIAIAKDQSARSHELLASLSLAKLYQSTGRPVEAHAVLAPALEGFAPTPEMPEIAEALTLLSQLA